MKQINKKETLSYRKRKRKYNKKENNIKGKTMKNIFEKKQSQFHFVHGHSQRPKQRITLVYNNGIYY